MKIAILTPKKFEDAETFIQNHITHLPFDKIAIYGGNFPYLTASKISSIYKKGIFKILNFIKRKIGLKTMSFKEQSLHKILKKEKIDFVFAEYLITGAETVSICEKLKIPIIAIALGYEISVNEVIEKYKFKYQRLFNYAKHIIIVSEHMKHNLELLDCPLEKIVYSPIGPDKNFFERKPNFESNKILAVGRFVDKKAPYLTIMAFQKVLLVIPNTILVMAGDGPLLSSCKDLVIALKIQNSIIFKGRISQDEHLSLLENSFMFVQHSKIAESGDSEGTPVAILEASATGLPVVSTLHAGIPDVVINEETGFLVPENDVDLMAEKMIYLLKNKNIAIQFGKNGKEYIKDNFSLEKHIDIISQCIEKSY